MASEREELQKTKVVLRKLFEVKLAQNKKNSKQNIRPLKIKIKEKNNNWHYKTCFRLLVSLNRNYNKLKSNLVA